MSEIKFNHFDDNGNAIMVDVGNKDITSRVAIAHGFISMKKETFYKIKEKDIKKGDVLSVSRIAGIMAVKKTPEIIPLAHTLLIEKVSIDFVLHEDKYIVEAICTVKNSGKTGVEMEALHGVSASLLTIYDMCKAIDRGMVINSIELLEKSGGKSGLYKKE